MSILSWSRATRHKTILSREEDWVEKSAESEELESVEFTFAQGAEYCDSLPESVGVFGERGTCYVLESLSQLITSEAILVSILKSRDQRGSLIGTQDAQPYAVTMHTWRPETYRALLYSLSLLQQ